MRNPLSLAGALAPLPISTSLTTVLLLSSLPLLASAAPAGLEIEVTKPVSCTRKTQVTDVISVNYRGTLTDGTPFDNSYDRGAPFEFTLGMGQVIKGWDLGLLDMCIGEGRKLTIPPELGYGDRGAGGVIGPGAVLVFETELMGIKGVKVQEPSPSSVVSSTPAAPVASPTGSEKGPKDDDEDDNGECHLLGPFALIIQGALGLLAISVLIYKRWRETPRRPVKIWFFDASKQVFGSVLLHMANLFMSMLSSGSFDVAAAAKASAVQDEGGNKPNPCSFYLLNIAVDTTIGIPILVLLLRILHVAFSYTPLANPPSSLRSGNYGNPPRATWWLKQSFIYFLGLFGMKLCVFALFQLLPWIAWVGDWALRWTEGNKRLQVAFVMLVFPLIMNAMQYWIIDSFIKDDKRITHAEDENEDGEGHGDVVRRGSEDEAFTVDDDDSDDESDEEAGLVKKKGLERETLKEANATPVPVRREYDPERDGAGSSGSDGSGLRAEEGLRKELGSR